jgi:hypothetical protein
MVLLSRKALSELQKVIIAVSLIAVIGGVGYGLGWFNRPPKAGFSFRTPTRTLKYIAPTDRDLIIFTNESTDPETPLEKLICNWYVRFNGTGDWKRLNSSTHHWGRLLVSNEKGHEIKLVVSDGMKEDSTTVILSVDPARLPRYSERRLRIPIKGICYNAGVGAFGREFRPPDDLEIQEDLTVIREELNCDGIRIFGDNEEKMLQCGELAFHSGFKIVMLNPLYVELPVNESAKRIIDFAKRVQAKSESINRPFVFVIGNEESIDTKGIFESPTREERKKEIQQRWTQAEYQNRLNNFLGLVLGEVKKVFKGKVTYASGTWEDVDWINLPFDVAGMNHYFNGDTNWYFRRLYYLQKSGKPIFATEFGCASYEGALQYGGGAYAQREGKTYSQQAQSNGIEQTLGLLNGRVDACFLWKFKIYKEDDRGSYGILRYNGRDKCFTRKLGFYAYQSFVVA